MVNARPPVSVSFILPVLNRRHCIVRAIESCLAGANERVNVTVLVIDGGSNDGTLDEISARYSSDARVVLLSQPEDRKGFMGACYFGVEMVTTDLATFMYSDDVLSPEFGRMAEALADMPDTSLVMGYGQQAAEDEVVAFPSGVRLRSVPATHVLDAFYGRVDRLDGRSLPVSPVCCLVRSDTLRSWADHVQRFVGNHALRQHSMIRLAGGQDLMVYLTAILASKNQVLVADGVVAQLTASRESITNTGNLAGQLLTGYWLARVWGMYQFMGKIPETVVKDLAGYVLAVWVYIVLGMLRCRDFYWLRPIVAECRLILGGAARQGILLGSFVAALQCTWVRLRMRAQEEK